MEQGEVCWGWGVGGPVVRGASQAWWEEEGAGGAGRAVGPGLNLQGA